MSEWTDVRVWEAVDAGRWRPPAAERVVADNYELVVSRGSYSLNFVYGFDVADARRVHQVLVDLEEAVRTRGGTGVRIWVSPLTRPADLGEQLIQHGYCQTEEAEVLVWELLSDEGRPQLPPFDDPAGVEVREAFTMQDYGHFRSLMAAVFQDPEPPEADQIAFDEEFRNRVRETGHSDRFVAWRATEPVGVAGMAIEPPVCRLFAAGVMPSERRRGIYGSLVRVRCRSAAIRGAEIALVTARVGTSGPILKHHGFRSVGGVRLYEARW